MKKTILLFSLLLTTFYGFSQNSLYGVRAGVNFSSLDFDTETTQNFDGRTAFAFGFFGEFSLTGNIEFAPEIQFSAEGIKEQSLRINYIQIPLFFKYKIKNDFAFGLGPQLGVKNNNLQDELEDLAFSILGGIEYMFYDDFFIDLRYSYGFTNVFDDFTGAPEAKNSNLQIGVGIKL